ncbi:MAG: hypothetical protein IJI46_01470 [Erysipelotrichaceae bacterium]|nr:hypothetical protein [Erysipelotrichaceae bacterium]
MKEKGLSDEELSTKSEITVDDLRKILYNKKVAGPFEMAMLAKALEEDMNAFFIEENDA